MNSLTAYFDEWVRSVEGMAEAIFKTAMQETVEEMTRPRGAGGNMPVLTGFLRNSLMASTAAMPLMNRAPASEGDPGNLGAADQVEAVIRGHEPGQTVHVGFSARYAAAVNYGRNGRPGALFVELAAQQWPQTVERISREAKARFGL